MNTMRSGFSNLIDAGLHVVHEAAWVWGAQCVERNLQILCSVQA